MKTIRNLLTISLINTLSLVGLVVFMLWNTPAAPVPIVLAQTTTRPTPLIIQVTATPKPVIATAGCIITIDNIKYNISTFKKIHSGGDVFHCGTDMSQIFWGQHGQQQLATMQKYRI